MKKMVKITSDETKIRKIVKNELEFAKDEWLGEFEQKVSDFKDEVVNGLDRVMGELKTMREE